jgi:hypothetical protein
LASAVSGSQVPRDMPPQHDRSEAGLLPLVALPPLTVDY